METNTEKIVEKLNALVQKNRDAEKGFEKAIEIAKAKTLMDWFKTRAEERREFREELKEEIHSYGFSCVQTPSLTGDLHRTWMDLKAALADDNDEAMLEEAMRGEKATLEEYNSAISEITMPPATEHILKSHRVKIEFGLSILRSLDDIRFQEES
ncbi:PA2169 family four-helix-bundle protein [Zobellia amurskyensis]|uniref:PA2169 family four-helix-bundle protein n=1 Tax=Zobellia amurskyensis TaxID=248905 RepID=A0A7X2ZX80_9FLAO|nr:PA2169 family four-helix-bundle protein [Zobellia amurskyensis]MUH38065.1 PA2169 family four-helix-bundle protein [Zobellia amurskyensis]